MGPMPATSHIVTDHGSSFICNIDNSVRSWQFVTQFTYMKPLTCQQLFDIFNKLLIKGVAGPYAKEAIEDF
jgi:hypothetical protein